jgi:hypothetical protein
MFLWQCDRISRWVASICSDDERLMLRDHRRHMWNGKAARPGR